jgi:hypothetical protein
MTNRKIEYWVIPPKADGAFVAHMEEVLEVYEKPYDPASPGLSLRASRKPPTRIALHTETLGGRQSRSLFFWRKHAPIPRVIAEAAALPEVCHYEPPRDLPLWARAALARRGLRGSSPGALPVAEAPRRSRAAKYCHRRRRPGKRIVAPDRRCYPLSSRRCRPVRANALPADRRGSTHGKEYLSSDHPCAADPNPPQLPASAGDALIAYAQRILNAIR